MSTAPPPDDTPRDAPPAEEPSAPPAEQPGEAPVAETGRRWGRRRPKAPEVTAPPAPAATPQGGEEAEPEAADAAGGAEARTDSPRRLRRERRALLTEREDAVYHLGGLAFELYRRDLLSEDVMRTRAGEVAQLDDSVRDIDVRLGEIDRERRQRRTAVPADPAVGCCMTCRTPFQAEARFCWQCGTQVVPPPIGGDDQPTQVISPAVGP